MAEVSSYLALLTPVPRKPLRVHEIETATSRTLRLVRSQFPILSIEDDQYGSRDYGVTQRIGAAINFLEMDGLISPSARWPCDNLAIFVENHGFDEKLCVRSSEEIDWQSWAKAHGLL